MEDQANGRIYRRTNSVYFVLAPTTNLRMHKCYDTCIRRMLCWVGRLQQDNVRVDEEALTRMSDETIASGEK